MESSTGYKHWRCARHLTRVTQLQHQLQELTEREYRARIHNKKLLQDFQRAQNTLSDLVAQTEAMNSIRIEYERYLEENYPKWLQKLQDKRLSEQQKIINQRLKACTSQTEEEGQRTDKVNKHSFRIKSPSAMSPDSSHCAIFNCHPHISDHRDNMEKDRKQHSINSTFSSMKLTQLQPPVTELEQNIISKSTKNIQNVHQAFNSPLPDSSLLSGDILHNLYSVVLQEPPSYDHLRQYPNLGGSGSERFTLSVQCPTDCLSWPWLPLIKGDKNGREEEGIQKDASLNSQSENHYMQKQRKKVNSINSKAAANSLPTEAQMRRNKRSEEKQTHKTRNEDTSSMSSSQSILKHKRSNQSDSRKTAFKKKVAGESPKQLLKEKEDDGTASSISEDKTGEEKEMLSNGWKHVNEGINRHSTQNCEKKANLCEEQNKEGKVEEKYGEQSNTDEEALRSNTCVKESVFEEVKEGVVEEEEEDREKGDEDEKSSVSERSSKGEEIESDQERNVNKGFTMDLESNIQDSLRELYKDDTEEDLTEKEENIEDDDDDDDDDDVIVEKASSWPSHPDCKDTKYQDDDADDDDDDDGDNDNDDDTDNDDDNDDIEDLLTPQNFSLQYPAVEHEEILKLKGLHSDSEENGKGKDEPHNSADEFDHFYD